MSAAFYIVLEREIPGLDAGVDGKLVCFHQERLDRLAADLDRRGLYDFVGCDPSEVLGQMEEWGASPEDLARLAPVWLSSGEGRDLVEALRGALLEQEDFPGRDSLVEDLAGFSRVLTAAAEAGVGWYLAVDY